MTIRAQISSDTIASSCGIEVHVGSPVLALCRRLVAEGCDPTSPLEAFRAGTLCLHIRAIGAAAKLRVNTAGTGFMTRQEPTSAPPMSLNAEEAAFPMRKPNNDSVTLSSCAA
jgi:hypothetical protein